MARTNWLKWHHPEHGDYEMRPAGEPKDCFERNYFDAMKELVCRKWQLLALDPPYPEMRRAELFDLGLPSRNPSAQVLIVDFSKDPRAGTMVKPQALKESLAVNRCLCIDAGRGKIAVSPFYEWELAEYWDSGLYWAD